MAKKELPAQLNAGPAIEIQYMTFAQRLRQIRKEKGLSQEKFAALLGTSKQILSLYELGQRSPKIEQIENFARILQVSPSYLLGDNDDEATLENMFPNRKGKPFYQIFIEVTYDRMGLDIPGVARVTGLTDRQVRTIIVRQMKDAPLPLALQLSETLNVPLRVWTGEETYEQGEVSADAYEVARAYDKASLKDRNIARLALDLEQIGEDQG